MGNEPPDLSSITGRRRNERVVFEYGTLETAFRIVDDGTGYSFATRDRVSAPGPSFVDTEAMKANGFKIQVSRIDAAFAQPGGGLRVQAVTSRGTPVDATTMLRGRPDHGILPTMTRKAFALA